MQRFGDRSNRPKPIFHPPIIWQRIQHEFIRGEGSTRALAQRHGVRRSTLQARCQREGWVELREMYAETALDDLILDGSGQMGG